MLFFVVIYCIKSPKHYVEVWDCEVQLVFCKVLYTVPMCYVSNYHFSVIHWISWTNTGLKREHPGDTHPRSTHRSSDSHTGVTPDTLTPAHAQPPFLPYILCMSCPKQTPDGFSVPGWGGLSALLGGVDRDWGWEWKLALWRPPLSQEHYQSVPRLKSPF